MSGRPVARRQRHWPSDLRVVVIVAAAFLITSPVDDGTTRFVLLLAVAVVVGLLVRLSGVGWRRLSGRRRRGGA